MNSLKFSEIVCENRKINKALSGESFRVTVLTNITVNPLKDVLEYRLGVEGIKTDIVIGDYDNILQDAEKYRESDAFIVFWEAANYLPGMSYNATLSSKDELDQVINRCELELELLFKTLKNAPLVLFNRFSSLAFNYNQLQLDEFDLLVQRMNTLLESYAGRNLFSVNLDRMIASIGVANAISPQNFYASKALYTLPMIKQYANQVAPILSSLRGKTKKLLILDCDNTLWPGIVGEDGVEGVLSKYDKPIGTPYREVQAIVAALVKRGVLVGICSKNNDQDVTDVFIADEDMKLRPEHLCIRKVNWEDKATNIRSIANTLNIGLDSIVFVDDSDFEAQFIHKSLPEVMVAQVPSAVHEYPAMMRELANNFFALTQTEEDAKKLNMYKSESERTEVKREFENLEDYLRFLNLLVVVKVNPCALVTRLSQLTQKTNQFNLTTHRYSEAEMEHILSSEDYRTYAFDVSDRFGSYGTVGLLIVEYKETALTANVDTFLMSCRAMGRNVEFAFFKEILSDLKGKGVEYLYSEYIPTAKNIPVASLYDELGFSLIESASGVTKKYVLNLKDARPHSPDYIKTELNYER